MMGPPDAETSLTTRAFVETIPALKTWRTAGQPIMPYQHHMSDTDTSQKYLSSQTWHTQLQRDGWYHMSMVISTE